MKIKSIIAISLLLTLFTNRSWAPPPLTAFTYQGQLIEAGVPANGSYDFRLAVFDDETLGDVVGSRVDVLAVPVRNGLFTVECDPGEGVFDGSPRWLQLAVRPQGGSLTTLTPRQRLTATPQAQFAVKAGQADNLATLLPVSQVVGTLPDTQLTANIARLNTSPTFQGEVRAGRFAGDGGGLTNVNAATLGGLSPGAFWQLGGNAGTTPGTHFLGTTDNQPLEFRVNGTRAFRVEPLTEGRVNLAAGYRSNEVTGAGSVITGGGAEPDIQISYPQHIPTTNTVYRQQIVAAPFSSIGGGVGNVIQTNSSGSVIGGGSFNLVGSRAADCVIAGGRDNNIATDALGGTIAGGIENNIGSLSQRSAIGGGWLNTIAAESPYAAIPGGYLNGIGTNSICSAIGGGWLNTIAAESAYATIPGGYNNTATNYAFAAGRRAKASHTGAFVWGDGTDADIASTNASSVTMRASGGYRLFANTNATVGVFLAAGSGSWTTLSDRNAKENWSPVDAQTVLEKVAALPLATWNYKSQATSVRHIGPMAQDFKAAFAVGESETGITTVDADGVALAAIQGLNQKVEAENAALRQELAELKALVQQLTKPGQ